MLAAVLGLTNVAMKATQSLITRGPRVLKPAEVSSRHVRLIFVEVKIADIISSILGMCD